ncbi:hypothetical protein DE146DRAFT_450534 [Phaeosphaeria sp. MPI-PUGE-AT-0046c]|nr:hypothetical protein DE146DRAFT_450534 [Phaeosphaeria sp. MPI-PUGE-AT-0046c]
MLYRRRATFPSASCFHRRADHELANICGQTLERPRIPSPISISRHRPRPLVTVTRLPSMQSNTPPPISPIATCRWKRGRPVYASYGSVRSRHSAPITRSSITAPSSTCASTDCLVAQQGQIRHSSSGQNSAPQSMLNNEDSVSNILGHMSLVEAQRITHSQKVPEHITLPDIPSQSSFHGNIEQAVAKEAQNSHQEESGAHNCVKDQNTTKNSSIQGKHSMNDSSDSDYVPSQDFDSSLEARKNDIESEESESIKEEEEEEEEQKEEHVNLKYQIPADTLRAAMLATPNTRASFWSAQMYRGAEGQSLSTHYCRTMEIAERVAQYFLVHKVVGFDIEWKPFSNPNSIKTNASLIQLACEDRIALFHISQFTGTTPEQLMPPTLKAILESPDIYKVGVAVKNDFNRLQKYLDIQPRGIFELSRLHNLVEWYGKDEKLSASKKLVKLALQVEQHLQLPLYKGSQLADDPVDTANVRESDWSKPLNPKQIHYAAADAYAGFRLYHILEWKRKQLRPTPPTRGVCDYDAKRVEKPKVPKKERAATKAGEDSVVAKQDPSMVELDQELKQEQIQETVEEESNEDDEESYETAPEEIIDSHKIEDATLSSVLAARQATASTNSFTDGSTRSQRRIGRVNMSWLRGPEPGYPILPQEPEDSNASSKSLLSHNPTHSVTDAQDAKQSIRAWEVEPYKDEDDEFADPELEEALHDLNLDVDGKLTESANKHPSVLKNNVTQVGTLESSHTQRADELAAHHSNKADMNKLSLDSSSNAELLTVSEDNTRTKEYTSAMTWTQEYLQSTIPSPTSTAPSRIRATTAHLRAYHLWYHQRLSIEDVASHLREPPLAHSTVAGYILQAVSLERLEYDKDTMREMLKTLPTGLRQGRWKSMVEKVG